VNGCYKLATRKQGWADAGFECRSAHTDSHLVLISDAQEQDALVRMFSTSDRQLIYTLSFGLLA